MLNCDPSIIKKMMPDEAWQNYVEAMDLLILSCTAPESNPNFFAAVARVSIDTYFDAVEELVCPTY